MNVDSNLSDLRLECTTHILERLGTNDLFTLSRVSKNLYQTVKQDNTLWRERYKSHFSEKYSHCSTIAKNSTWYDRFVESQRVKWWSNTRIARAIKIIGPTFSRGYTLGLTHAASNATMEIFSTAAITTALFFALVCYNASKYFDECDTTRFCTATDLQGICAQSNDYRIPLAMAVLGSLSLILISPIVGPSTKTHKAYGMGVGAICAGVGSVKELIKSK